MISIIILGNTNEQIVNAVARNYGIRKLIHKLITNSSLDQTDVDLEQYIYFVLLNMDNEKLQILYDKKELRKFISQIIKNQRNTGKFYKSLTLNMIELTGIEVVDESEHNYRLDFIMDKIDNVVNKVYFTGLTQLQLREISSITYMYLYFIKGVPKHRICIEYSIGSSTLDNFIRSGKKYIREYYDKEFDEWFEKINKENDINSNFNDDSV